MKSIFEIITILVFLLIITLFQKMYEGYCCNAYDTPAVPNPVPSNGPSKNNNIIVTASYKAGVANAKPSNIKPHSVRFHKG